MLPTSRPFSSKAEDEAAYWQRELRTLIENLERATGVSVRITREEDFRNGELLYGEMTDNLYPSNSKKFKKKLRADDVFLRDMRYPDYASSYYGRAAIDFFYEIVGAMTG